MRFILDNNNICSLKPLAKMHSPLLKKIHFSMLLCYGIDQNFVKEVELGRVRICRNVISFESEISCGNLPTQEDMSFLVKANCEAIRSISKCVRFIGYQHFAPS